ncbi:MAG: [protein-PII] uridylyltransferase [Gammaproteobacteria bacterium]
MQNSLAVDQLSCLSEYKDYLAEIQEAAREDFTRTLNTREIVTGRAERIDGLISTMWRNHGLGEKHACIAAVGGYGRGELHPYSDVDIAILLADEPDAVTSEALQSFVTELWDLGLDIGHSVRTTAEAFDAAEADITVMTNLLESRAIAGNSALLDATRERILDDGHWRPEIFFAAKLEEQNARYQKFDNALQQLEPNVKESPGGLRDIQMISWVANRYFRSAGLDSLLSNNFLTQEEFDTLYSGEEFLWRVRCALHFLTKRHDDRLAFDHQKSVAEMLGYTGKAPNEAVENLMKDYYRTVRELSCLNEVLLNLFDEAILQAAEQPVIKPLNRRFQLQNQALDVKTDSVFKRSPYAMLELFLILQQHPEVQQITARTIRLLLANRHRIDEKFRRDIRAQSLFMEIIRQPRHIGHELQRMHKYGILSAYLPVFAKVEGLMQFDLFHIYTVDEHALFVLRFMRRFSFPESEQDRIALVPYVIESIPKLELLYIAGLYHDIAKGRGGDHSELGADEVAAFCQQHGLSNFDTHLVAWLVRNHLLMSMIAQRKDISDINVIASFAEQVGEQIFLDYLYLLTVADIRGTNPELFNGWKESLLAELYSATRRYLANSEELRKPTYERVADTRNNALELLKKEGHEPTDVEALWEDFDDEYFIRHRVQEITWHARNILSHKDNETPLVCVDNFDHRKATAVFIYAEDSRNLFARTTAALDKLQLDIQDARISTSARGYTLDTYMVLDSASAEPILEQAMLDRISRKITEAVTDDDMQIPPLTREATRALKNFAAPTHVDFEYDEAHNYTIMGVHTVDRPGLLSLIGQVMREQDIQLHDARIATIGERAEDYFCISPNVNEHSTNSSPNLGPATQERLRKAICAALD